MLWFYLRILLWTKSTVIYSIFWLVVKAHLSHSYKGKQSYIYIYIYIYIDIYIYMIYIYIYIYIHIYIQESYLIYIYIYGPWIYILLKENTLSAYVFLDLRCNFTYILSINITLSLNFVAQSFYSLRWLTGSLE